jgi:uncharacterized membrane protein YozB (DUF420 family)
MNLSYFPIINASLNGASAIFLLIAYVFIKSRRYVAHATMMIVALLSSTAFLTCYLIYHAMLVRRGVTLTPFPQSTLRPYYLILLGSHTILAVVILPLILMTVWWASRRKWPRHRSVSVWAFPLWLYVSITGVVIYWMLYHVAPTLHKTDALMSHPAQARADHVQWSIETDL